MPASGHLLQVSLFGSDLQSTKRRLLTVPLIRVSCCRESTGMLQKCKFFCKTRPWVAKGEGSCLQLKRSAAETALLWSRFPTHCAVLFLLQQFTGVHINEARGIDPYYCFFDGRRMCVSHHTDL